MTVAQQRPQILQLLGRQPDRRKATFHQHLQNQLRIAPIIFLLPPVDGGATASYVYDALGRRVKRTVGSSSYEYIYDNDGHIGWELLNGSINRTYIRSNGKLVAEYSQGTTFFIHQDHLGSTRLVTGYPTPTVVECDDYYAYGEANVNVGSCLAATKTTYKFTNDERDAETNLDHTDFRQYSSALGRWTTPDPAGLRAASVSNPQTWNRYTYVLNNPLVFIDPTGLECVWDDGSFDSIDDPGTGRQPLCEQAGGTWIDHSFFSDFGLPDWSGAPVGDLSAVLGNLQNGASLVQTGTGINGWSLQQNATGNNGMSFWDYLSVPWSGTVLFPLVPFGPVASGGVGPTVAYNPRTDTGCAGLAAGAMVPAGGRAAAIGPLTVGNLGNADSILAGGSVFAGAQSPNPAVGVQAMGNTSGLLAGGTFGSPGVTAGVSVSGCKPGVGKAILNWAIDYLF